MLLAWEFLGLLHPMTKLILENPEFFSSHALLGMVMSSLSCETFPTGQLCSLPSWYVVSGSALEVANNISLLLLVLQCNQFIIRLFFFKLSCSNEVYNSNSRGIIHGPDKLLSFITQIFLEHHSLPNILKIAWYFWGVCIFFQRFNLPSRVKCYLQKMSLCPTQWKCWVLTKMYKLHIQALMLAQICLSVSCFLDSLSPEV